MTATLPVLGVLVFVGVATWTAQAYLIRATRQAAWDRHVREAEEAADWAGDPTRVHDALAAEDRFVPVTELMGRRMVADLDAWREGQR